MNFVKAIATAAVATFIGTAASAATLTLTGTNSLDVIPADFNLIGKTGLAVGTPITVYTGGDSGGLTLSAAGPVRYEYIGKEASNENTAAAVSFGTLFNTTTSSEGDFVYVMDDGGVVDFSFSDLSDGETITNGDYGSADAGLSIAFYQVDPNTFIVLFGDGAGDTDFDDIAIKISAVPLPAGAVLLLSGLGGFAALRRRKKA